MKSPKGHSDSLERINGGLAAHKDELVAEGVLQRARAALADVRVTVMVLGPGEGGHGYEKRVQIQEALNAMDGVTALFPEDEAFIDLATKRLGADPSDVVALELAQAMLCNIILALDMAAGVNQEVAQFAIYDELRGKIRDLVEDKHSKTPNSYPAHVRRQVTQIFFTEDEFQSCDLATKRCPALITNEKIRRALR